jgi:hypothetical protein
MTIHDKKHIVQKHKVTRLGDPTRTTRWMRAMRKHDDLLGTQLINFTMHGTLLI